MTDELCGNVGGDSYNPAEGALVEELRKAPRNLDGRWYFVWDLTKELQNTDFDVQRSPSCCFDHVMFERNIHLTYW